MNKIGEPISKEGNIFELSIMGSFESNAKSAIKLIAEEITNNSFQIYNYEISTYFLESFNSNYQNVSNLVEFHQNMHEFYLNNEFTVDNNQFFNGISYKDKIEEYFLISKSFIKYITNSYIKFPSGENSIIEMARCDISMKQILVSLGYGIKSKIRKRGEFIKYKNYPILICINYSIEPVADPSITMESKKIENIIEIFGFCNEIEKENFFPIINSIKEKLSTYCTF